MEELKLDMFVVRFQWIFSRWSQALGAIVNVFQALFKLRTMIQDSYPSKAQACFCT